MENIDKVASYIVHEVQHVASYWVNVNTYATAIYISSHRTQKSDGKCRKSFTAATVFVVFQADSAQCRCLVPLLLLSDTGYSELTPESTSSFQCKWTHRGLCTYLFVILLLFQHPRMSNSYSPYSRFCSRIAVPLATATLILVAFPFNRSLVYSLLVYGRYPPLYPHHRELELQLPHYQSYEHSDVKYLWSPNHPASMLTDTLLRKPR